MKNIAIIGSGCVGSVLAKHLTENVPACTTYLIAKGKRAHRLKTEGVTVNGETYFFPVLKEPGVPLDLLFVCVKNYDMDTACEDFRELIRPETIILPLLNSVSPTPTLRERFPKNRVLYGFIQKLDAYRENGAFFYHIAGDIHFGYENNKTIRPELAAIREILEQAGFQASIDPDMLHAVWKKWMLNVGANQVSALTEANYLQFAAIPEIEEILRLAMQELVTIACYEKVDLGTKDILETLHYLTTFPYPKQTSMLQDVLAHRRTEVDYISGDIIRLSRKWNCPCPVNLAMYYLIKSKEKAYLSES